MKINAELKTGTKILETLLVDLFEDYAEGPVATEESVKWYLEKYILELFESTRANYAFTIHTQGE